MQPCPWPKNQLKKLSRHIRDGTEPPESLPPYRDVMLWYNELAADVQRQIAAVDWSPLLQDRAFEVTSRPKTLDTLRQKLRREPSIPLPNVQDVAGVRFEAEMSLDEQDAVATAVAGMFAHDLDGCLHDLRNDPHSGYRAVHLWFRLEGRVEVQIRTHLQSSWANAYESAADLYGRDIRYEELPEGADERRVVTSLRDVSTRLIAQMERDRNEMEKLNLIVEDRRNGLGAATDDTLDDSGARLALIKARFQDNEQKLQQGLHQLRKLFDEVRDARKV